MIYTLLDSAKVHILLAHYLAAKGIMHYRLMHSKLEKERRDRESSDRRATIRELEFHVQKKSWAQKLCSHVCQRDPRWCY